MTEGRKCVEWALGVWMWEELRVKENNEITENILWASENANYRGKVSETTYHPMSAPYKKDVGSGLNIVILSKVTFLTTSSISRSTTYSPVD